MKKAILYLWIFLLFVLITWVIFASKLSGWDAMKMPLAILAVWIIVPAGILFLQDRLETKKRMGKYWKNPKITNTVFGEIEYWQSGWRTVEKFPLSLFGRTYAADVVAMVDIKKVEEVNDLQESAFQTFKELIVRRRSEIEQVITDHFNEVSANSDYNCRYRENYDLTDIPSRFVPSSIKITRNGDVAICVSDDAEEYGEYDDWDEGFVITILPELKVLSKEYYQGLVSGGSFPG